MLQILKKNNNFLEKVIKKTFMPSQAEHQENKQVSIYIFDRVMFNNIHIESLFSFLSLKIRQEDLSPLSVNCLLVVVK